MKEFFEEYGRTIVTVLIILGIILVGYVIAGNGRTSAFGKFTTDVVDSLSYQADSLIKDSAEYLERTAGEKHTPAIADRGQGTAKIESTKQDGIISVTVNGKADPTWESKDTATTSTDSRIPVPWGKKSVMSFDFFCDRDCMMWIDFNADIEGITGNDNYIYDTGGLYIDGAKICSAGYVTAQKIESGSWHHIICVMENGNSGKNPQHKSFTHMWNSISYGQDGGTTHCQIKNITYGVA